MEDDAIRPMIGINKELSLQFVLGYTPLEFMDTLGALADGRIDVAPLVTGKVGVERRRAGVPRPGLARAAREDPGRALARSRARAAHDSRRRGMLAGLALGAVARHRWRTLSLGDVARRSTRSSRIAEPIGTIFLRLLFMLVMPLIVSALALGVAGLGDMRRLGRIGLKTLAYTVVVSSDRGADRRRRW